MSEWSIAHVLGTQFPETLEGTDAAYRVTGLFIDDQIFTLSVDDRLLASPVNYHLFAIARDELL